MLYMGYQYSRDLEYMKTLRSRAIGFDMIAFYDARIQQMQDGQLREWGKLEQRLLGRSSGEWEKLEQKIHDRLMKTPCS